MTYIQNQPLIELKPGKYTIYTVSDFMATTQRQLITLERVEARESYAQYKNLQMLVFKAKGKRTTIGYYLKESMLILEGWNDTLKIDTDYNSFCGNALLNFVCDGYTAEQLKEKILQNKNPYFEKGIVVFKGVEHEPMTDGTPLFMPEAIVAAPHHAVMRRIVGANEFRADGV